MIDELWKEIPGYEGQYEVSNLGRIRTCANRITINSKGHIRHWKQRIMRTRYGSTDRRPDGVRDESIILYRDGKPKTWRVHQLVALAWCSGYSEGMTVNHKDCNHLNNRADNLEWITRQENITHAIANGRFSSHYKPVTIKVDGKMRQFPTMKEASLALGKHQYYVYGKLRTKRGRIELGVDG